MDVQRNEGELYRNRTEAGRILAASLRRFRGEQPAVIALPRGGVPVGYEVARALQVPLELWVVRKLATALEPERAMGAIAEGGARYVDWEEAARRGAGREEVERATRAQRIEVERRVQRFRQGRAPPALEGRTAILVDDGVATGRTLRAVLQAVRSQRPAQVVLAVPVAAEPVLRALAPLVDELVCAQVEKDVAEVGDFYEDYRLPTDDEIAELLRRAWQELAPHPGHPA